MVRDRANDQTADRQILWRFVKDRNLFRLLLDGIHYGQNNVLVQHFEATVARRRCQAVRIDASGLRWFAHIAPLISFAMSAAAVAGT